MASNVLNVALEARFTLASKAIISPAYSETPDDGSLYCWMEVRPLYYVLGVHPKPSKTACACHAPAGRAC
jgi:hypothetical protein